jgi:hypothetical protein
MTITAKHCPQREHHVDYKDVSLFVPEGVVIPRWEDDPRAANKHGKLLMTTKCKR